MIHLYTNTRIYAQTFDDTLKRTMSHITSHYCNTVISNVTHIIVHNFLLQLLQMIFRLNQRAIIFNEMANFLCVCVRVCMFSSVSFNNFLATLMENVQNLDIANAIVAAKRIVKWGEY